MRLGSIWLALILALTGCSGRTLEVRKADGSSLVYRNDMFDTKVGRAEFKTADGSTLVLENMDSQAALAKEVAAGIVSAFKAGLAAAAPVTQPIDLLND